MRRKRLIMRHGVGAAPSKSESSGVGHEKAMKRIYEETHQCGGERVVLINPLQNLDVFASVFGDYNSKLC